MIPLIQTPWKKQYNRLTEEERKTYHRDKMRQIRKEKRNYYLRFMRWMPWIYVNEKLIFNENDMKYIKSIAI